MPHIPEHIRIAKHKIFQFFPGTIGLRNRACLHHLQKPSAESFFRKALQDVSKNDILIDCGANVGTFSKVFAGLGGRVHSFEPDPWSFGQLSKNLEFFPHVELHNKAVGIEDGTITFYRAKHFDSDPGSLSLASSVNRRPGISQDAVQVQVIDLVDFVNSLDGEVGILKLDIEGAEVPVLEKIFESDCLSRIKYIFAETHELQFPELLRRTARLRRRAAHISPTVVNLDWH